MEIEEIDNNLVPQDSQPTEEPRLTKPELIEKVVTSFLHEDRFVNFMCIRKGKVRID